MKSLMYFEKTGAGNPACGLQASDPAGADPAFLPLMQVMA